MPRVSVLIPSYNHARFLRECLGSIQAQTFDDWEVVLVDDGSTDDSVALAHDIARTEPRLRVFQNTQNLGTYGTEARALELAQGELIAVMNSDDLWSPLKLERQVAALDRHPDAPFAFVLGWLVDDAGVESVEDVHADWPRDERSELLPYLLYENRVLASGVLFRRAGLRFEPTCRYSGDWVALLERAFTAPVVGVPERLTFWRQHDHNTYRFSSKQLREEIRVREAIAARGREFFLPRLDPREVRRGLFRNAMNLFALYVYFGERARARRAGWNAFRFGTDRKSALKRTLSGFLPEAYLRDYFWREEQRAKVGVPYEAMRNTLESQTPLVLRLEG